METKCGVQLSPGYECILDTGHDGPHVTEVVDVPPDMGMVLSKMMDGLDAQGQEREELLAKMRRSLRQIHLLLAGGVALLLVQFGLLINSIIEAVAQ